MNDNNLLRPPCLTDDERTALLSGANCLNRLEPEKAAILRRFVRDDLPIGFVQWKSRVFAQELLSLAEACRFGGTSKKVVEDRLREIAEMCCNPADEFDLVTLRSQHVAA